jgi:limonene-1,2-epoxide hydrolase
MTEDWIALCTAKARYCRMLDTKDWDGLLALCTEDYELDVNEGRGTPPIRGREEAWAMVRRSIGEAITAHQVHMPEIAIDGDEAHAIWPMQDRVLWGPDRPSLTGYGHYHERWVRTQDGWKLASLRLTRLHIDFAQAAG